MAIKFSFYLFILVSVLCTSIHNATSQETDIRDNHEVKSNNSRLLTERETTSLAKFDQKDLRGKIKNTAHKAWNTVKLITEKAKEKIKSWVKDVKEAADHITKAIKERLHKIKENLEKLIAIAQSDLMKQCIKDEKVSLDELFEELLGSMMTCIGQSLKNISLLEDHGKLNLEENNFKEKVESKLDTCVKESKNVEDCFLQVKKGIYDEMYIIENNVLHYHSASRNIVDDLLDAIMKCSINGVMEATAAVAVEAEEIIKCVIEGEKTTPSSIPRNLTFLDINLP